MNISSSTEPIMVVEHSTKNEIKIFKVIIPPKYSLSL